MSNENEMNLSVQDEYLMQENYVGEYKHTLDAKNRLFIPASYRKTLGPEFVISISLNFDCLKIYSQKEWRLFQSEISKLKGPRKEVVLRTINRLAFHAVPDSQGRVVIPANQIAHAKIVKNCHVIGCGNTAEIWAEEELTKRIEEEENILMIREYYQELEI